MTPMDRRRLARGEGSAYSTTVAKPAAPAFVAKPVALVQARESRATEATADQLVASGAYGGAYGIDPIDGDRGYTRLGASGRQVPSWTLEKARAFSVAAYRANPMARAILDTYTSFCVGDSGVSYQCSSDVVRPIVDEFWNDPRNNLGALQTLMLQDKMLMGELVYEMMVGPQTGVTRFSPIDPTRLTGVDVFRGNPLWPETLHIRQPGGDDLLRQVVSVDDFSGLRTGEVIFSPAWKTTLTDRRGYPFLAPILDDLDDYDTVLSNLIDRTALARYLVWDVTVDGDQKAVNDFIAARGGRHVPASGSVEVHNSGVTWEAKTAETGAQEDTATSKAILTNVAGGAGLAKAQPLDSKVLTPSGWRTMGDLRVGDEVLTPKGVPSKVLGIYPQGSIETFEVTFSDGAKTRASGDHLWLTSTSKDRDRRRPGTVKTTAAIAATLRYGPKWNHYVPLTEPVDMAAEDLPVDPYVLGVLLGDGHMRTKRDGATEVLLSSVDQQLVDEVNGLLAVGEFSPIEGTCDFRYVAGRAHVRRVGTLRQDLSALGLVGSRSHTKFVPAAYKAGSAKDRLSLLQGLLDTDGSPSANTSAMFSTTSRTLADDVRDLVWGLGGVCSLRADQTRYEYRGAHHAGREAYRLRVTLPEGLTYFRLARKQSQIGTAQKRGRAVRSVRSVTPVGRMECQCIMIDDPDHLYVTDDYIVTHNTWLAEPEDANRATSLTMAEPVRRRVGGVQNMWLADMRFLVQFAVDQAVAVGRIPAMVDAMDATSGQSRQVPAAQTVTITGPEIAAADAQVTAEILNNLASSLSEMVVGKILSPQAARIAARKAWEQFVGVPWTSDLEVADAGADDLADELDKATPAAVNLRLA